MDGGKPVTERGKTERTLKRLQRIKTWQLIILLVLSTFVSATFLRLNNIGMVQRREAVLSADKASDVDVLQNRLYDLQRYSADHMNASTGAVYLQGAYDREAERRHQEAQQAQTGSENIYKKIEDEVCGPQARANGWRWPDPRYLSCQQKELEKYGAANVASTDISPPNADLFRHSFLSPSWSPDFAGFSLVVTGLIMLMIVARILGSLVLRLLLHRYYKSV